MYFLFNFSVILPFIFFFFFLFSFPPFLLPFHSIAYILSFSTSNFPSLFIRFLLLLFCFTLLSHFPSPTPKPNFINFPSNLLSSVSFPKFTNSSSSPPTYFACPPPPIYSPNSLPPIPVSIPIPIPIPIPKRYINTHKNKQHAPQNLPLSLCIDSASV